MRIEREATIQRPAAAMESPMTDSLRGMRTTCAAMLFAAASLASAETSPYYIGVNQAFSYDSNVFRLPDAFAEASSWSSTSVVAGFDQPYGRQRFYANGNVAANVYQQLSQLDNTSYGLTAGWDWATIERLTGKLYVSLNQGLGNYGGSNQVLTTRKNIQNDALVYGTVQWGLLSLLALDGRVAYSSLRYSDNRYARYELNQQSVSLGVRKEFSGQLTLGSGLTYTKGDYYSVDQQFDRYDIYLTGAWVASGQSTLRGRLNYSDWDYTGSNPYQRSGVTGWVQWAFVPTGKLSFNTLLSYDTLANAGLTDLGGGSVGSQGDSNQLTWAFQFNANYAASAKVKVNAFLNYYTRTQDYQVNPPAGLPQSTLETRDRVTNLGLGATWTPTRNWLLNCNLSSNNRNQDANQPITLSPYQAWGASCSAQFALQ